jgi:hypothetical protein
MKQEINATEVAPHFTILPQASVHMFLGLQGWKMYILTGKPLLLEKKDVTHCQIWTAGSVDEYMYGLIFWDRTALCAVTKSYGHAATDMIWGAFPPPTPCKLISTMVY